MAALPIQQGGLAASRNRIELLTVAATAVGQWGGYCFDERVTDRRRPLGFFRIGAGLHYALLH